MKKQFKTSKSFYVWVATLFGTALLGVYLSFQGQQPTQLLPADETATLAKWYNDALSATVDATMLSNMCVNTGFQPVAWVQYTPGVTKRNLVCEGGANGKYIGACPCAENIFKNFAGTDFPATVINGTPFLAGTNLPSTGTSTPTNVPPTIVPTLTPSATNTPVLQNTMCAYIVWDRNLNIRPSASLFNSSLGYYLQGKTVSIEGIVEVVETVNGMPYYETWAKVNRGQYFALEINGRTYATVVDCP